MTLLLALSLAQAQTITFETLPNGSEPIEQSTVTDEWEASTGVSFALLQRGTGSVLGGAVLARAGDPTTAFEGCVAGDTPDPGQSVGEWFLTDGDAVAIEADLEVRYAAPVRRASGVLLDVDCRSGGSASCEQWTITAYDAADQPVDTYVLDAPVGPPRPECQSPGNGPGDGAAVGWFFARPTADISRLVFAYTGTAPNVGLAFDNFSTSELAPLTVSAEADTSRIFRGESAALSGAAVGGLPPYTYQWQTRTPGGAWVDTPNVEPSLDLSPADDVEIRLSVSDQAGQTVTSEVVELDVTGVVYRLSQESAPGAADFAANPLGTVVPYDTDLTAAEWYGWTDGTAPYAGPEPALVDDRSHLFLVHNRDGLSLYMVHDSGTDASGGDAETRIELVGDTAEFVVQDDANLDTFTISGDHYDAQLSWAANRTDGFALGSLDAQWTATIAFTDVRIGGSTLSNLTSWVAHSGDGSSTTLALEEDRRVRIEAVPEALILAQSEMVRQEPGWFTVRGLYPGEDVFLGYSLLPAGPGPCPALLGGACLGLRQPALIGTLTADSEGTAEFSVTVPGSAPVGPFQTQAAAARGAESVISNVVESEIR